MLDMHNPGLSLPITLKAVLILDPWLDIRLRNAPFYSSRNFPSPRHHIQYEMELLFLLYICRDWSIFHRGASTFSRVESFRQ